MLGITGFLLVRIKMPGLGFFFSDADPWEGVVGDTHQRNTHQQNKPLNPHFPPNF